MIDWSKAPEGYDWLHKTIRGNWLFSKSKPIAKYTGDKTRYWESTGKVADAPCYDWTFSGSLYDSLKQRPKPTDEYRSGAGFVLPGTREEFKALAIHQLEKSDGSTANYYALPSDATELQHLISSKDMNAQIGEIFRACYRYGQVSHSPKIRDIKKIIFYAQAELERLELLESDQAL